MLGSFDCKCGQNHNCDIKYVSVKENAITDLPEILKPFNRPLIVADKNTFKAAGEKVLSVLGDTNYKKYIFEDEGILVPDESAVSRLTAQAEKDTDIILGIGSGVIQDLCKYVSFELDLPYIIVATAPSMDGYASKGAAMITGNMKVTYNARVPYAIIGDTEILKDAPMEMIKSGYGDILGKFSCLNDWKLSAVVNGEYICDYVWNLTYEMLLKTKDAGAKLLARDQKAIEDLTNALIGVGVLMAYVGNSRPASGSEHHLSHFFEVMGIMKNEPYFLHGIDVAYSAYITAILREKLLKGGKPEKENKFNREVWEKQTDEVYLRAAEGVKKLQDETGWHEKNLFPVYRNKWDEISAVLSEAPSPAEMKEYLSSVELDLDEFYGRYGEKIETAIRHAMDLKDRYTVLWLYNSVF